MTHEYTYSAFGELLFFEEECFNPWRYGAKRFEAELGLIDFGSRLYDPALGRWLSPDPAGAINSTNLYQYCFNKPLLYTDPDGEYIFAISLLMWGGEIVLPSLASIGTSIVYGIVTSAVAYSGYKFSEYMNSHTHDSDNRRFDFRVKNEHVHSHDEEEDVFPDNPDDLMPDKPRDSKGHIQINDHVRIRPEKHPLEEGKAYKPRHHGQHYHVDTRRDPKISWNNQNNAQKIYPEGYNRGDGSGFLPGEKLPKF